MSDERMTGELNKEDYAEPQCLLNMHAALPEAPARPIPMSRIIEKLDEHLSRDDWAAAERHLDYWLADALAGGNVIVIFLLYGGFPQARFIQFCLRIFQ